MKIKEAGIKTPLGIYIHIPFCVKKCNYCDFLSMSADQQNLEAYFSTLQSEIKLFARLTGEYQISTVYVGGGTPSFVPVHYIEEMLTALRESFVFPEQEDLEMTEISMEANPGTLTKEKLKSYHAAGINRLSMGVQSADNRQLKELGRIHTWEDFLQNYQMAREAGFHNMNIDLMSALPGQSVDGWEETLNQAVALEPEHISAYSLIIEEATPFYIKYNGGDSSLLPSEEEVHSMDGITDRVLSQAGYERYEISNYAKRGHACRHNISYWRGTEYIGLGLGASSLFGNARFSNETNMKAYTERVGRGGFPCQMDRKRTLKEQMEEFMFLGLRMVSGVSAKEFREQFHMDVDSVYGNVIRKFTRIQGMVFEGDRLYLTPMGMDISNQIFAEFLLD